MGNTSAASINKYMKKTYKRLTVLAKPQEAERIKDYASKHGMTVTQFLIWCANQQMEKDKKPPSPESV